MYGFTDKPLNSAAGDEFGIQQYISGLSEFILECDTPMTIAIQGDWGSGKTSMMNMIRECLGDSAVISWFNTWQYSQFNMDDTLAVSFLSQLINDLRIEDGKKDGKMEKTLKTIFKFVQKTGVIMLDTMVGGKIADTVENSLQAAEEQPGIDMAQAIRELKDQFEAAVNAKIVQSGKDRLVIFIDDLDRLNPGKAVELLEVLKLFLDCDKCVFVLAIDYAVVSQGVKQKYGDLIGEEKGRSFFDKIIQVPFKMPVAKYNVRHYVTNSFHSLGIEVTENEIQSYEKLIQTSVGFNPRAMKRLFNAFLLLNKVSAGDEISKPEQRKVLFAILCLQLSFENIYNYIVGHPEECSDELLLQTLATPDAYRDADKLPLELRLDDDSEIQSVTAFMTEFNKVLDQDGNEGLSAEELSAFITILGVSTITSSTATEVAAEESRESRYRYYNREIIKEINAAINGEGKPEFKVYQTRTNRGNWRKHYACGWTYIPCAFGQIGLEFKIATNLQQSESDLSIWIYPVDKTDRKRFRESLEPWCQEQTYGFTFLESDCGFWLNNKTVNADARDEIISYFTQIVPEITGEVMAQL